jgi:hypothetical protein
VAQDVNIFRTIASDLYSDDGEKAENIVGCAHA